MKKLYLLALVPFVFAAPAYAKDCDTACATALANARAIAAAEHEAHVTAKDNAAAAIKADTTLTNKQREDALRQNHRKDEIAHRNEEKELKTSKKAAYNL